MNDKQIDALLEQMKKRGSVAGTGGRSADDFLAEFRKKTALRRNLKGASVLFIVTYIVRSFMYHYVNLKTAIAAGIMLASATYGIHACVQWKRQKEARAVVDNVVKQPALPAKAFAETKESTNKFDKFICAEYDSSARETWRFLPCFSHNVLGVEALNTAEGHFYDEIPAAARTLLEPESGLSEEQRSNVRWHAVEFPHREFMWRRPNMNHYGWYGCEFHIPNFLQDMDIYADITFSDRISGETFVNGMKIDDIGILPPPDFKQNDSVYRIPSHNLSPFRNYIALRVFRLNRFGGIASPPVLKAALVPSDAHWDIAFISGGDLSFDHLNSADTFEKALEAMEANQRLEWKAEPLPWKGCASWNINVHYAVFKTSFTLKNGDFPKHFETPVVMDLGPVFDVAAFYLNGRRIGIVGRFPEGEAPAFTEAAQRARIVVPPDAWAQDGDNELAAVVYDERGVGGLSGAPGIVLHNPLADGADADVHDLYNIYIQSFMPQMAERLLANAKADSARVKVRLLSDKAHLSFLRWFDGGKRDAALLEGVLSPIAEILRTLPQEAPAQSAMQAFCHVLRLAEKDKTVLDIAQKHFPEFGKSCITLSPDRTTWGDWQLLYGNVVAILPASEKDADFVNPTDYMNQYKVETGDPECAAARRRPYGLTAYGVSKKRHDWSDPAWLSDFWRSSGRFLGLENKQAGEWNDQPFDIHPFDDAGPDLLVTLERPIASGQSLSVYLRDYDWNHTLHPRQQSILMFDVSGNLLNACWSGKSSLGVYERFLFTKETKAHFRVIKHRGATAAISGVFIDEPGTLSFDEKADVSPNAMAALQLAVDVERLYSIQSDIYEYKKLLKKIDDWDSVLWIADMLSQSRTMHNAWMALTAGRLMELKGNNLDTRRREALKAVALRCSSTQTVPFASLLTKIAEE